MAEPAPEREPSAPPHSSEIRPSTGGGAAPTIAAPPTDNMTLSGRHSAAVAAHYAFLMAGHPRLGAASPAGCLTPDLLEYIVRLKQATNADNAYLLLAGGMTRNEGRLWSSSTVRAIHIATGGWHKESALPNDVSGHAVLCCPPSVVGTSGECEPVGRPLLSSIPVSIECMLVGGFEDVARSSAQCHTLCVRAEPATVGGTNGSAWNHGPAMREPRHGGFAAAVVDCGDSSVSPAACRCTAVNTDMCSDLPPASGSVVAVAGGRSGLSVLASAEWLCNDRACWYPLSSLKRERYGCAGASLPNQFVVIGGSAGRRNLASVEALDLRTRGWRELAPLPKALYGCAASSLRISSTQRAIITCGGCDESRSAVGETYIYDVVADRWRTTGQRRSSSALDADPTFGSLRTPRMCHAVAAVPRRCLPPELWSGLFKNAGECKHETADASDITTAATEECMLALGGKPPNDASPIHDTVEVFDPRRCEWATMEWRLPEPMWHHSACVVFV